MTVFSETFPRYVAIEGPIGAGKTSLARRLAARHGAFALMESFEENPFLAKFYEDRRSYAFQTEMFFLLSRFRQQEQLGQTDLFSPWSVSDYLFIKSRLFAGLTLDDHELALYDRMYSILAPQVPTPDVVVYLQAPLEVLLERVQTRDRSFERAMEPEYLERLKALYHNFFQHYEETALVEIDSSQLDLDDEQALDALLVKIQQAHERATAPRRALRLV